MDTGIEPKTTNGKSLRKRFLFFTLFFAVIVAITVLTKATPFDQLAVKEMVLDKTPEFIIERDVSSKNHDIEHKIIFSFVEYDTTFNIGDADLAFADRKAIQDEIVKGDTLEVTFHEQYFFICQLSKNGKTYLNPDKAFENGDNWELLVLVVSILGTVVCLIGFFLAEFLKKILDGFVLQ